VLLDGNEVVGGLCWFWREARLFEKDQRGDRYAEALEIGSRDADVYVGIVRLDIGDLIFYVGASAADALAVNGNAGLDNRRAASSLEPVFLRVLLAVLAMR